MSSASNAQQIVDHHPKQHMTMQQHIQRAFNKAHPTYDEHCHLQTHTGQTLIQHIVSSQQQCAYPSVIDLGCGSGIITLQLAQALSFDYLYAIDFAEQLLRKAQQRLTDPKIHCLLKNFDEPLHLSSQFDIVFSNLALHWSSDFTQLLSRIQTILAPKGILAFSIPLSGTLNELTDVCAIHHFADAQQIVEQLNHCGYDVKFMQQEVFTQDFSDTATALRSLKHVGANTTANQNHGLRSAKWLKQLQINRLSYHIGYFIVKR